MKTTLILALALSSSAFAATKTLNDYKNDADAIIDIPSVNFSGTMIKADNVCVTPDSFKTINPIKVCVESNAQVCRTIVLRNGNEIERCRPQGLNEVVVEDGNTFIKGGCLAYENLDLETSRVHASQKCVEYKTVEHANGNTHEVCAKYETVNTIASDLFEISVLKEFDSKHSGYSLRKVASFKMAMPSCN